MRLVAYDTLIRMTLAHSSWCSSAVIMILTGIARNEEQHVQWKQNPGWKLWQLGCLMGAAVTAHGDRYDGFQAQ
jgi:hypothetical protein